MSVYRWPDTDTTFNPRQEPLPPPVSEVDDLPGVIVTINYAWIPHILGVLEVLAVPEAWDGTEAQQYLATQEIERLMNQLGA